MEKPERESESEWESEKDTWKAQGSWHCVYFAYSLICVQYTHGYSMYQGHNKLHNRPFVKYSNFTIGIFVSPNVNSNDAVTTTTTIFEIKEGKRKKNKRRERKKSILEQKKQNHIEQKGKDTRKQTRKLSLFHYFSPIADSGNGHKRQWVIKKCFNITWNRRGLLQFHLFDLYCQIGKHIILLLFHLYHFHIENQKSEMRYKINTHKHKNTCAILKSRAETTFVAIP